MTSGTVTRRKGRIFYGWFALAGVMLVIFTMSGAFVNSFGVFLPVICEKMGWSRATVAMALSIGIMSFGLPSPLFGIFVARFGARFTIIWGNLLAAMAIACLSLVQAIWHVYLLYVIIGIGGGFGGYIACSTIANNWFIKKRSLAMGLFTACGALGGFVFPPLTTALISSIGWRLSWVILAGVVLIGAVVGGVILIRNKPEDMGEVPDGVRTGSYSDIEIADLTSAAGEKHTGGLTRQMLRQPVIWMIAAFAIANAFAVGTMNTHQVAYLEDINFSAMTAATTVSLMAAMSAIGSVSFGALALKVNVRNLAIIAFTCELLALVILLTTRQLGLIYIYAMLLGIGNGALTTAMPTFVGINFGRASYAQALGVVLPFQVGAQAVAAFVAGIIYDATKSYTPAFLVVAACIVAGLVVVSVFRISQR